MIAALFVYKNGSYQGLPGVDPWDIGRDARKYKGPHPVVAHPPCARWCRMAHMVEAVYGYRVGEDGGCFESALNSVRKWGGVLEHPAWSLAWGKYGLPYPEMSGGWTKTFCGGWVCNVYQIQYGHAAVKPTWLYCHGIVDPPSMRWGRGAKKTNFVVGGRNAGSPNLTTHRLSKKEAIHTPVEFRDALIEIAMLSQ